MKTELELFREQIDEIDKTIAKNFEKRMEIVTRVGEYKKLHNLNTFDPTREQKMKEKNVNYIKNPLLKKYYLQLLDATLILSKQYQEELKKQKQE